MSSAAVVIKLTQNSQDSMQFGHSECCRVNPLYTGELFHCYMLDESIHHFRGVRSVLSLLFNF